MTDAGTLLAVLKVRPILEMKPEEDPTVEATTRNKIAAARHLVRLNDAIIIVPLMLSLG
jgi:hypothetical protein